MGGPIEFILAKVMFTQRKKGVVLTDQRVRMTSEVCWAPEPSHQRDGFTATCLADRGVVIGAVGHPAHQVLRLGDFLCPPSE